MLTLANITRLCALWLCAFLFGAALMAFSLPIEAISPAAKTPKFFGVRAEPQPRAVLLPRGKELGEVTKALPSTPIKPFKPEHRVTPQDIESLLALSPMLPMSTLNPLELTESFRAPRSGGRIHRAIDLFAPRGTPIRAITDGTIAVKFTSDLGGNCLYQKTPDGSFMFFYAHLSRYAKGLKEGQTVTRGDIIGYVGDTGNAKGNPHLHFGIAKLLAAEALWSRVLVNPYYIFTQKPYPFPKKRR
jgi:murein DD-endopeptidase MepM/ murein hydrolase activator NlpD